MNNYDKMLDEAVERANEKRNMSLADLIESENLQTYVRGYVDILYADDMNVSMIPYHGYMILTRTRIDDATGDWVAEYAIYRRTGKDSFGNDIGEWNGNVFVAEAEFKLEHAGEETFEDMVSAIKYASDLIDRISDDPVDIVREMTDGDPLKDLTEEDAVHLIAEAVNKGYAVPANLTPEMFLEIYSDLKGEN